MNLSVCDVCEIETETVVCGDMIWNPEGTSFILCMDDVCDICGEEK